MLKRGPQFLQTPARQARAESGFFSIELGEQNEGGNDGVFGRVGAAENFISFFLIEHDKFHTMQGEAKRAKTLEQVLIQRFLKIELRNLCVPIDYFYFLNSFKIS